MNLESLRLERGILSFASTQIKGTKPQLSQEVSVTIEEFRASLTMAEPSQGLDLALQALWWDAQGNWDRAHACAQVNEADPSAAWVHAYLHRKEGDLANAGYWYRRAGRPVARDELQTECVAMATALLGSENPRRTGWA